MALGNPTPPIEPIPPIVGPVQLIPRLQTVVPRQNSLVQLARYLRYKIILQRRKNRKTKNLTNHKIPPGFDARA